MPESWTAAHDVVQTGVVVIVWRILMFKLQTLAPLLLKGGEEQDCRQQLPVPAEAEAVVTAVAIVVTAARQP